MTVIEFILIRAISLILTVLFIATAITYSLNGELLFMAIQVFGSIVALSTFMFFDGLFKGYIDWFHDEE